MVAYPDGLPGKLLLVGRAGQRREPLRDLQRAPVDQGGRRRRLGFAGRRRLAGVGGDIADHGPGQQEAEHRERELVLELHRSGRGQGMSDSDIGKPKAGRGGTRKATGRRLSISPSSVRLVEGTRAENIPPSEGPRPCNTRSSSTTLKGRWPP